MASPIAYSALDFVELSAIAKKHNVTPRQAYDIYTDISEKLVHSPLSETYVKPDENGYKGDPYSQIE